MPKDIGSITAADEMLCHQTTNTFAVAGQNDLGWTEKIWSTFGRKDGSLQCDCGVENGRLVTDTVRWHQAGTVEGRVRIDGEGIDVRPDEWFAFRDRSWGVRQFVGAEPPDLPPADRASYLHNLQVHWSPLVLQ